jgi:hypothetical protein
MACELRQQDRTLLLVVVRILFNLEERHRTATEFMKLPATTGDIRVVIETGHAKT